MQAPLEQAPGHVLLHEPQFLGSTWRFVHCPLQSVVPPGQLHLPATQLTPVGHCVTQSPQCVASVCVSRH